MQSIGKLMYVKYVLKEGEFKGNAFVRFISEQDTNRLLNMYQEIENNPE